MNPRAVLFALARLALIDPIAGGRAILALNPPLIARWMLLAAAVLAMSVVFYLLPLAQGSAEDLMPPFAFAATQGAMNVFVVALITHVGRGFGGTGRFADALWLMGWLQVLTVALLVAQVLAMVALPFLIDPVAVAAIALSIWVLVGFVCALHGFTSRARVLVGGVMVFVVASFVLAMLLLVLGFAPTEFQ